MLATMLNNKAYRNGATWRPYILIMFEVLGFDSTLSGRKAIQKHMPIAEEAVSKLPEMIAFRASAGDAPVKKEVKAELDEEGKKIHKDGEPAVKRRRRHPQAAENISVLEPAVRRGRPPKIKRESQEGEPAPIKRARHEEGGSGSSGSSSDSEESSSSSMDPAAIAARRGAPAAIVRAAGEEEGSSSDSDEDSSDSDDAKANLAVAEVQMNNGSTARTGLLLASKMLVRTGLRCSCHYCPVKECPDAR